MESWHSFIRDAANVFLEKLEKLKHFNKFYDEGQEAFAADIATAIRTICKGSKTTQSLLEQTNYKSKIIFLMYSDLRVNEENLLTSSPLCIMKLTTGLGASFEPKLDDVKQIGGNEYMAEFNLWWEQIVIKDAVGNKFTRKDLIETVCDKEGGAHYDSKLDQKSKNLFYENSIAWNVVSSNHPTPKPFNNKVHYASIRHISYELVGALSDLLH